MCTMCVHVCLYTYTLGYVYRHVYVYMYVYMYVHIYTQTHANHIEIARKSCVGLRSLFSTSKSSYK